MTEINELSLKKIEKNADHLRVREMIGLLNLSTDGTPAEQSVRLAEFLEDRIPKPHAVRCQACSSRIDDRLRFCPVCRDEEEDTDDQQSEVVTELRVPEAPPVKVEKTEKRKKKLTNGAAKADADSVEVEKAQTNGVASSAETLQLPPLEMVEVIGEVVAEVPVTELVKLEVKEDESATEADLDAAVERIKKHVYGNSHDVGTELAAVYCGKLWRKRIGKEGTPAYAHWTEFVRAETPFATQYTYRLMTIAVNFQREEFVALGVKGSVETLRVPASDRPKMIEAAKAGASVAELNELASEIIGDSNQQELKTPGAGTFKGKKGPGRSVGQTKNAAKGKSKPPPAEEKRKSPPREKKLTIVHVPGKAKIELFAKGGKKGEEAKRASPNKNPDGAWGEEELENGILVRYAIRKMAKGWEITIERGEPAMVSG